MPHESQQNIRKSSLIGRIVPTEVFLLLAGIATLTYGIVNDMTMSIFWGCIIIPGVIILHYVRKTDWTKHWQEMEAEQKAGIECAAQRRSAAEKERMVADDGK
ncbi:MAG: hypothetical protein PHF56_08120 [Desulfuromonadaceae bacterium]|nr:hypothetical protein [Desulfuromonadaceae bacterium]